LLKILMWSSLNKRAIVAWSTASTQSSLGKTASDNNLFAGSRESLAKWSADPGNPELFGLARHFASPWRLTDFTYL
jgi:hypothetical protein